MGSVTLEGEACERQRGDIGRDGVGWSEGEPRCKAEDPGRQGDACHSENLNGEEANSMGEEMLPERGD